MTLRNLRENMQEYAAKVQKGRTFIVFKKSQPLFKIVPLDEGRWEEVIDFTEIQRGGVDIEDLLKRL